MRCNFFLLVALAAKVYAGPVFVDLGTIFIPLDINNSGQMLGTIPDGNRTAALWNLGGHNAHFSVVSGGEPIAINDVGQILLSFGISQNGVFMALPARFSDLNNSAQLVGTSDNTAVLFQNGMQTNLMPPSAHSSFGNGINDAGHVVGYFTIGPEFGPFQQSGFLWRNGQFTQIGPLPGGQSGGASGLNSSDQVIGTSSQGESW